MYLLLLLLLSVTLWDVRSSKAEDSGCPAGATIEIRELLPSRSNSPNWFTLECTLIMNEGGGPSVFNPYYDMEWWTEWYPVEESRYYPEYTPAGGSVSRIVSRTTDQIMTCKVKDYMYKEICSKTYVVESRQNDDDLTCPLSATIAIRRLPMPADLPHWVKLECTFTYPGGASPDELGSSYYVWWKVGNNRSSVFYSEPYTPDGVTSTITVSPTTADQNVTCYVMDKRLNGEGCVQSYVVGPGRPVPPTTIEDNYFCRPSATMQLTTLPGRRHSPQEAYLQCAFRASPAELSNRYFVWWKVGNRLHSLLYPEIWDDGRVNSGIRLNRTDADQIVTCHVVEEISRDTCSQTVVLGPRRIIQYIGTH